MTSGENQDRRTALNSLETKYNGHGPTVKDRVPIRAVFTRRLYAAIASAFAFCF